MWWLDKNFYFMQKTNDPRAEISGLYLCPSLGLQTTCLQYLISYSEHSIIWRTSNQAPERTSREAGQGERSGFSALSCLTAFRRICSSPANLWFAITCRHLAEEGCLHSSFGTNLFRFLHVPSSSSPNSPLCADFLTPSIRHSQKYFIVSYWILTGVTAPITVSFTTMYIFG